MKNKNLVKFGFSFKRGGAHLARTMMLEDISKLLSFINNPNIKWGKDRGKDVES